MRVLKNQPWNENPSYQETAAEVDWNLWSTRQWPFNALEEGDTVYLVARDGAGGSVITWETEILKVLTERYQSRREAFEIITAAFPALVASGFTRQQFLAQDYTRERPAAGWLLAYNYEPVRYIGVPRPADLKFRPNGWAPLDGHSDAQLRRWGILSRAATNTRSPSRFVRHRGRVILSSAPPSNVGLWPSPEMSCFYWGGRRARSLIRRLGPRTTSRTESRGVVGLEV